MGTWIRQFTCGLGGHDELLHFEKDRVSLVCATCGHESPGWEVAGPRPAVTARGDRSRHQLTRPRLVEHRRAA